MNPSILADNGPDRDRFARLESRECVNHYNETTFSIPTVMHPDLPIVHDQPLAGLNTFRIPASARRYLRVTGAEQLTAVRADPALADLPRLVLGGGSNLLFTQDFDGLVLHMAGQGREILGQQGDKILVRAQAGENWHAFVGFTLDQGLGAWKTCP